MRAFYVYVYLDPRKRGHYCYSDVSFLHEPIYVGKGHGDRCLQHLRGLSTRWGNLHFKNKLRKILQDGFNKQAIQDCILIFKSNLEEQEAFDLEKQLVLEIGRRDLKTGPLCNWKEGGRGGGSFSERTKKLLSSKKLGKNKGRRHSEETKKKMREAHIGKPRSEKARQKMREAWKKRSRFLTADVKKKISESMRGEANPNFGKARSEETRRKISNSRKETEARKRINGQSEETKKENFEDIQS